MKKILFTFIATISIYFMINNKDIYIKKNQRIVNCKDCLVQREETAIKIAESVLFEYYGESKIKDERPYRIELKDQVWIIKGTLNNSILDKLLYRGVSVFGGIFEIRINGKDGKVISITHYK